MRGDAFRGKPRLRCDYPVGAKLLSSVGVKFGQFRASRLLFVPTTVLKLERRNRVLNWQHFIAVPHFHCAWPTQASPAGGRRGLGPLINFLVYLFTQQIIVIISLLSNCD